MGFDQHCWAGLLVIFAYTVATIQASFANAARFLTAFQSKLAKLVREGFAFA